MNRFVIYSTIILDFITMTIIHLINIYVYVFFNVLPSYAYFRATDFEDSSSARSKSYLFMTISDLKFKNHLLI